AGGAVHADPSNGNMNLQFDFVTFTNNESDAYGGGAIKTEYDTSVALHNSILWADLAPLGFPKGIARANPTNFPTDPRLVKGSAGTAAWAPALGTDGGFNLDVDPHLGAGYPIGSTQTLSPGEGSPAIDAASDVACPADDQRDITRPQGAHCDIGAVETFPVN